MVGFPQVQSHQTRQSRRAFRTALRRFGSDDRNRRVQIYLAENRQLNDTVAGEEIPMLVYFH